MKTSQSGRDVLVKDVKLAIPGKKGFLGIGKKPDLYEVEILLLAAVEIIYRTKVKISVKIGKNSIGVGQLDWVLDYMPIISSGTYPKSTQEMSRKQILEWQEKQGFRTIGAFSWAGFQFGYKSGNETVRITERGGGLETDYIIARTGIKSWAIVDETGRYTD
jgi:hypothetical protein